MKKQRYKSGTKRDMNKTVSSVIKIATVVLLILIVLFAALRLIDNNSGVTKGDGGFYSTEESYTYSVQSDSVRDMKKFGGGVVLLTENSTVYLNSRGAVIRKNQHSYSNAAISVSKTRVLLYNIGTVNYRLENSTGVISDGVANGNIITAEIAKNNSFALASRAEGALSTLTVYKSDGKECFKWNCSSEHIIAISLAPNSNRAAVSVTGAKDARIYSKVHIFDFEYTDALFSYEYTDNIVHSLDFIKSNALIACSDEALISISKDSSADILHFSDGSLKKYSFNPESKRQSLIYSKFGNETLNAMEIFNSSGEQLYATDIPDRVIWLDSSQLYVTIAFSDRVETLSYTGKTVGTVYLPSVVERVCLVGDEVFVLTANGINVYKATDFLNVEHAQVNTEPETIMATTLPQTESDTEQGTTRPNVG